MRNGDPDAGPRKAKKKAPSYGGRDSASTTNNWRFVQSTLSEAEKTAWKEWSAENPDVLEFQDYYARHGIKFTITYQESTSSYISAATCKNPESVNNDTTFSSHHRTSQQALSLTIWKLEFKLTLDTSWAGNQPTGETWG